ncbi:MAG TPA: RES domain-containing protein [Sphingomicrobium sp.]|nr:RES domain-containing protein [Sphingomicrobium sp.]
MRFKGQCFRGHDPTWSFSAISGDGAAKAGGRFNRKGEPTLYLALDIVTAINECMQGLTQRLQPLTVCEYDVDCEPIADSRTEAGRKALSIKLDDLACPWLTYLRAGKDAPSWLVADTLRVEGYAGMLVPSFAPGAGADDSNLILWRWGPKLPTKVTVFDPSGRLPKDQLSWS